MSVPETQVYKPLIRDKIIGYLFKHYLFLRDTYTCQYFYGIHIHDTYTCQYFYGNQASDLLDNKMNMSLAF